MSNTSDKSSSCKWQSYYPGEKKPHCMIANIAKWQIGFFECQFITKQFLCPLHLGSGDEPSEDLVIRIVNDCRDAVETVASKNGITFGAMTTIFDIQEQAAAVASQIDSSKDKAGWKNSMMTLNDVAGILKVLNAK